MRQLHLEKIDCGLQSMVGKRLKNGQETNITLVCFRIIYFQKYTSLRTIICQIFKQYFFGPKSIFKKIIY